MDLQALLAQALSSAARTRKPTPAEAWAETLQQSYNLVGYEAKIWRSTCLACGAISVGLAGIYEVKQHNRFAHQRVWHRLNHNDLVPEMPADIVLIEEEEATCLNCIESLGFNLGDVPGLEIDLGPEVPDEEPEEEADPFDDPIEDEPEDEPDDSPIGEEAAVFVTFKE